MALLCGRGRLLSLFSMPSGNTDPIREWLAAVARLLRLSEPLAVREYDAARILSATVEGCPMEIGCSADFWVDAAVEWPSLPSLAFLAHAPIDSYSRAKYVEDGVLPAATGHAEFDATFLIFNLDENQMAAAFPRPLQDALLAAAPFSPAINVRDTIGALEGRASLKHIRITPDIRDDPSGSVVVALGDQRFTPAHCARAVEALVPLVKAIRTVAAEPRVDP